jgi:hypothetical protein
MFISMTMEAKVAATAYWSDTIEESTLIEDDERGDEN